MKAIFFTQPGDRSVLQYGEAPTPKPEPGEVLIRVKVCGLNRLDLWLRKEQVSGMHIPGSDVAGIVEAANGKSELQIGQEVVVNPAIPCGSCPRCMSKQPCELVTILGAKTHGGYAEYIVAPIGQVYPKPLKLSFVEAAAFPLTYLTAWHMLVGRANLQRGESVFVWGAAGSLGSAAVQLAHHLGARVIAAARSAETANKVRSLGADEIVLYKETNVVQEARRLTSGLGVDVVFESVGAKTWQRTLAMLRMLGRVVIAGTTSGDMGTQDLSDIYYRQLTILGARMGTKEEFEKVLGLMNAGVVKPLIDSVFPLQRAADAQRRMEEGKHVGKIVLEIP